MPRDDALDNDAAMARRRRRTDDTRRWRSRCRRRVQLFQIEIDDQAIDMAIKFGGLEESQLDDRDKVSAALGRLLRSGIVCLLEKQPLKKV